jgi:hypothetical protein
MRYEVAHKLSQNFKRMKYFTDTNLTRIGPRIAKLENIENCKNKTWNKNFSYHMIADDILKIPYQLLSYADFKTSILFELKYNFLH